MTLAPYIHAMGRGPGRARSLTQEEARDAMAQILAGQAAPEAVGALLMLMRYRGETPGEIAGFVEALRATLPKIATPPTLDWPSYAAGRSRGLPWFLLSAMLVGQAGERELMHGWNSACHQNEATSVLDALPGLGIAVAERLADLGPLMASRGLVYLPLELIRLREVLGLRSAVNTVLRVVNPGRAQAAVQGVFHPPYRALQADAGALLGQPAMTVLKGGGGEFERHPSNDVALFGLRARAEAPALYDYTRRLADEAPDPADLGRLWRGEIENDFAEAVVLGTAALALATLGHEDAAAMARLWDKRLDAKAA